MTRVGRYVPDALSEAGVGTAGGAAELLQAAYGAGDLEARGHMEAAAPHLGRETVTGGERVQVGTAGEAYNRPAPVTEEGRRVLP